MDFILGKTKALTKAISSKDLETVMEYGAVILKAIRLMKAIICWTKNTDTESILGEMAIIIKAILQKT
jgi:hypothetical protein